jgi:sulfur carrier protein
MNITVNGQTREIPENSTLQALLADLGLAEKPVVIELNREALFPREYASTIIPNDAVIEIVVMAAGG